MMRRAVASAAAAGRFSQCAAAAAAASGLKSRSNSLSQGAHPACRLSAGGQKRFATDAQTVRAPHKFENFCAPESRLYVEELYEMWQKDRTSIDPSWGPVFENLASATPDEALLSVFRRPQPITQDITERDRVDNMKLAWMIRAYETRGHHTASLDPLGMFEADLDFTTPAELEPQFFGFTEADMSRTFNVHLGAKFGGLVTEGSTTMTLQEIISKLKQYYCGNIAFEFMHAGFVEKRNWWRQKVMQTIDTPPTMAERMLNLENIIKAERFEKFLHTKFATHKRFGLDGAEALVAAMNSLIDQASQLGAENFVVGMPHRGRLNVLTNVCGKPFVRIFNEFTGKTAGEDTDAFHSGDVKYHLGISRDVDTASGKSVNIQLLANPSHLEAVNPLVLGKSRAKQLYLKDTDCKKVMPIIMHGDASFSGQGVCYESMGLSDLEHFDVGGTIHVVVNNQVGFTTDPWQSRSAMYCTDLAKVNNAPVIHVNADDVDAVARAARIAAEYRQVYNTDVIIDLVCYRRYGHNESDEPMFTQPLMYRKIKTHPSVLTNYGDRLVSEGVLTRDDLNARIKAFDSVLKKDFEAAAQLPAQPIYVPGESDESPAESYVNTLELQSLRRTAVDKSVLQDLGRKLTTLPEGFTPHPTIAARVLQPRAEAVNKCEGVDWGLAESLAFGTLLMEGVHVRITGQDVQRGTFSHRHAVIHDVATGKSYCPLSNITKSQAPITVSNSSLSEFGVCGFEMGYSMENPKSLVIWEAQFGDFANGAQVVFDQFMASGEAKWMRQSSLVVSLPHGYDGMGPEHSSARLERFLQLSDDTTDTFPRDFNTKEWQHISEKRIKEANWQVCYPSTPANYFHMLRRQVHREFRKPLVFVFSKKYLRAPNVSRMEEMADGSRFLCVIPHEKPIAKTRKIVFCSGQIYHILSEHQAKDEERFADVALIRVEQLAPFPVEAVVDQLQLHLASNPDAEVVWAQEEPKNMGAWSFVRPRFGNCLEHVGRSGAAARLRYVGRPAAASPATGFGFMHEEETAAIKSDLFA